MAKTKLYVPDRYADKKVEKKVEKEEKPELQVSDAYTEENKTVSLAYDDFIAPLIKSVQELSAEVDSLKKQLKKT